MKTERQEMIAFVDAHEYRPEERPSRQIEWPSRLRIRKAHRLRFSFVRWQVPHIDDTQGIAGGRRDHLNRMLAAQDQGRSENLVTPHDLSQARPSTATSSAPVKRNAGTMLYAVVPESSPSKNQRPS